MNIRIKENIETALQVIIECRKADAEVMKLKSHIELFENRLQGKLNEKLFLINPSEVLYFESVDDRTFMYTQENVYEIKYRLYELGNILSEKDFIRISKAQIVNIGKIKTLHPELNRSITATLINGEVLNISRRYAGALKTLLSI